MKRSRLVFAFAAWAIADSAGSSVPPSPSPSVSPRPRTSPAPSPSAPEGIVTPRPASPASAGGKTKFSNEDLPKRPSPSPGASGQSTPRPAPSPPATSGGETPSQEAEWRARANTQRAAIRSAEQTIKDLEEQIAALRNDRAPTNLLDPNREQNRQSAVAKAMAELDKARADLNNARKEWDDLEEEARRSRVPPGWLRER